MGKHPLHDFRLKHNLTQTQMAKMIGVTQGYIGHIERGLRLPRPRHVLAIEQATDGEVTRYQ